MRRDVNNYLFYRYKKAQHMLSFFHNKTSKLARKINALRIVVYDVLYVDQLSYVQRNERHA
jgi:hypothetical protein